MDTAIKIEELDVYSILEISINSTTSEIKKAYRKKALLCHPDKNPDNPNASIEFHRLTRILEVLTDAVARAAYDKVLRGRQEAALRHKQLDSKRKKLKEDLERREQFATSKTTDNLSVPIRKSDADKLQEEIQRLRKEGSRLVQEEMERMQKEVNEANRMAAAEESTIVRLKLKWNSSKNDPQNGGYNEELLRRFLLKYGDLGSIVVSQKNPGTGLVEFNSCRAATMALDMEIGIPSNPLKLEWFGTPPSTQKTRIDGNSLIKDSDYESVVLTRMRQAEERRKLCEQIRLDDESG